MMCALSRAFSLQKPENSPHKNDENDAETPPVQAKPLSDEIVVCFAKKSFCLLIFYDEQFCSSSLSFTFEHFVSPTRTTPPRNKDDDDKKQMETIIIINY
jgi:hypothetical protein